MILIYKINQGLVIPGSYHGDDYSLVTCRALTADEALRERMAKVVNEMGLASAKVRQILQYIKMIDLVFDLYSKNYTVFCPRLSVSVPPSLRTRSWPPPTKHSTS
jgi:hypothetical protein